jgi:hypothetical protein
MKRAHDRPQGADKSPSRAARRSRLSLSKLSTSTPVIASQFARSVTALLVPVPDPVEAGKSPPPDGSCSQLQPTSPSPPPCGSQNEDTKGGARAENFDTCVGTTPLPQDIGTSTTCSFATATIVLADVGGPAVDAFKRCPVCSIYLGVLDAHEQEAHINGCLDAESRVSAPQDGTDSVAAALQEKFACPMCPKDLTGWSETRRAMHINRCLERSAVAEQIMASPITAGQTMCELESRVVPRASDAHAVDSEDFLSTGARAAAPCPSCGKDLATASGSARLAHVKHCALLDAGRAHRAGGTGAGAGAGLSGASAAEILRALGLGRFAAALAASDVDAGALARLSEADMRELGLSVGARKRIAAVQPQLVKSQRASGALAGGTRAGVGGKSTEEIGDLREGARVGMAGAGCAADAAFAVQPEGRVLAPLGRVMERVTIRGRGRGRGCGGDAAVRVRPGDTGRGGVQRHLAARRRSAPPDEPGGACSQVELALALSVSAAQAEESATRGTEARVGGARAMEERRALATALVDAAAWGDAAALDSVEVGGLLEAIFDRKTVFDRDGKPSASLSQLDGDELPPSALAMRPGPAGVELHRPGLWAMCAGDAAAADACLEPFYNGVLGGLRLGRNEAAQGAEGRGTELEGTCAGGVAEIAQGRALRGAAAALAPSSPCEGGAVEGMELAPDSGENCEGASARSFLAGPGARMSEVAGVASPCVNQQGSYRGAGSGSDQGVSPGSPGSKSSSQGRWVTQTQPEAGTQNSLAEVRIGAEAVHAPSEAVACAVADLATGSKTVGQTRDSAMALLRDCIAQLPSPKRTMARERAVRAVARCIDRCRSSLRTLPPPTPTSPAHSVRRLCRP